jgi:hypothetical protein
MTSELDDDLRTVGEALIDDAERLKEIEQEKAGLDLRDPRLQELTAESERIVERLRIGTQAQGGLAREAEEARDEDADAIA